MASELELKLAATQDKLNLIKELEFPGVAKQTSWGGQMLGNVYFDTKHFRLRELAIGMRIRRIGERYVQRLKPKAAPWAGCTSAKKMK